MQLFLVTYDIRQPKRLRRVHQCMKSWGDALQYSVFRCELSPTDRARLKVELDDLIDPKADQILFIHLGPADGRGATAIDALGLPYVPPERRAIVVG